MALRAFGSWIVKRLSGDDPDAGGAPAAPFAPRAFVEAEAFEDDLNELEAPPSHFERYRRLIDSFEEDRESAFEKLVRGFFLALAYTLPMLVAYAMGKEIGEAYGGPF